MAALKTIGLVGGMSWESSAHYYRIINETVKNKLGGLHSAQCILSSLDFHPLEKAQAQGDWETVAEILATAALGLEQAGADFVLLCSNTAHKVAALVEKRITIPLLHIADVTAKEVSRNSIAKVGLLGTRFTLDENFYTDRLKQYGLEPLLPPAKERAQIDHIIFAELCRGIIKAESKQLCLAIMARLADRGAQGIILGCTEIGLIVGQEDTATPLFDTSAIHARAAAELALQP